MTWPNMVNNLTALGFNFINCYERKIKTCKYDSVDQKYWFEALKFNTWGL